MIVLTQGVTNHNFNHGRQLTDISARLLDAHILTDVTMRSGTKLDFNSESPFDER